MNSFFKTQHNKMHAFFLKVISQLIKLTPYGVLSISSLFIMQVQAEKISVVTEYLPPYQLQKSDGSLGGFSTQVIEELFNLTGDTPDIHVMPWARAYQTVQRKKNTMIYSIAHLPKRDQLFSWVGKLKTVKLYIWGLKSKFPSPIKSIDELKHHVIGISRESSAGQYVELLPFPNAYTVVDEEQTMNMLYKNRVDLIVGAEFLFKHRSSKLKLDYSKMIKLFEIKELNVDLRIAFNKDSSPELIKIYRGAFNQLEKSGRLNEIRRDWSIAEH